MSATAAPEDDRKSNRRNAIVTYEEVMNLHLKLAEVLSEVKRVGSLAEDHIKLELRVRSLEVQLATLTATTSQRNDTWSYVFHGMATLITMGLTLYNVVMK